MVITFTLMSVLIFPSCEWLLVDYFEVGLDFALSNKSSITNPPCRVVPRGDQFAIGFLAYLLNPRGPSILRCKFRESDVLLFCNWKFVI